MNPSMCFLEVACQRRQGKLLLDLNFSMQPGFVALFGPSGCGKTSTLKILAGLLRPHSGWIRLEGEPILDTRRHICLPPERREIGVVFQDNRLFPHLTVGENLQFGFTITPADKRRFHVGDVVSLLKLSPLLRRSPRHLSGGEAQRVAIGRALLASPKILLMDEPLAAVDLPARLALLIELRRIHRELNLPIVYVSHDLGSVLNVADTVLQMENGRIIKQGSPAAVLQNYVSESLLREEAIRNILEVEILRHSPASGTSLVRSGALEFVLPLLDEPEGTHLLFDIPASEIILGLQPPSGLSARNVLPARVRDILRLGKRIVVEVDAGARLLVEIVEAALETLKLEKGRQIYLIIKATAFRRLR